MTTIAEFGTSAAQDAVGDDDHSVSSDRSRHAEGLCEYQRAAKGEILHWLDA